MAFGKLLTELRRQRGLGLHQLSERSGLSIRAISYLEGGLREPLMLTVVDLAHGLDVEPGELLNPLMELPRE
ncbi:helix-turn-helix domain-containing protein [Amycolatopsis sp. RM579]|uniref:Helix-turn-helix domain-containing protein n=1 Tax=Amycolatopsis pithecellobii TaxID=664692 RepID=A0A6N7Z8U8_9PSEU|nr:helix-turn-helix domain-containing protein [Amycolatopsis pithecellobii]